MRDEMQAVKNQQGVAARRLAAFGVDYLVILGWVVLITTVAARVRTQFGLRLGASQTPHDKLIGHGLGFISLTLPVTLYFAIGEHSAWRVTLGKHTLGVRVERVGGGPVSLPRSLVRSILKFTPWELAHTVIWHSPGQPFVASPSAWGVAGYTLALALAALYLGSTMVGDGRTPYDRVAGTLVRHAIAQAPPSH